MLGAYGDGGAVITSDAEVDAAPAQAALLRHGEGLLRRATPGHNSRLDELQAEILRRKLRRLDAYIAGRRAVARRYAEGLGDTGLVGCLPAVADGNEHVYYVYVVRHPQPRRDHGGAAGRTTSS